MPANVDFYSGFIYQMLNIPEELCVYVNTERVCAKEMVLFPYQTCPEHMHVETEGKDVKKGDIIGGIGECGGLERSDAPHLHFELMKNGEYENPEQYFSR